jgi:hypothetical protein
MTLVWNCINSSTSDKRKHNTKLRTSLTQIFWWGQRPSGVIGPCPRADTLRIITQLNMKEAAAKPWCLCESGWSKKKQICQYEGFMLFTIKISIFSKFIEHCSTKFQRQMTDEKFGGSGSLKPQTPKKFCPYCGIMSTVQISEETDENDVSWRTLS